MKGCTTTLKTSKMSNKPAIDHLKSKKHYFSEERINPLKPAAKIAKITTYTHEVKIKDTIQVAVSKLVALSNIPINKIAHDDTLRALLEYKYKVSLSKSPSSITKIIIDHATEIENILKNEIKTLNGFTIMFDEWTSRANVRFLNLILRSESAEFNLGVIKVEGSATAANLLGLIKEKLLVFGLNLSDLFSFTSDGAAVNKKISQDTGLHIQQCFNHAIHLGKSYFFPSCSTFF